MVTVKLRFLEEEARMVALALRALQKKAVAAGHVRAFAYVADSIEHQLALLPPEYPASTMQPFGSKRRRAGR